MLIFVQPVTGFQVASVHSMEDLAAKSNSSGSIGVKNMARYFRSGLIM